ncbi:ABC transporter ATP-binding protein [Vibrio ouci]|uniref:ABC transporter ATP-binding protein n=1 Tax=Vibrio ouci TaxID=2499078 RepID=A0A4Y8WJU9_9VIBR|nr:ABC transporter ATP-binding protein [Vibrio ouci]
MSERRSNLPLVVLNNVCKYYSNGESEVRALDNINLTIHQGEFLSILGPSGSGKSTLMNVLGCLDKPSSGEYHLAGQNVASLHTDQLADIRNRNIGFVFQSFNLLEYATALDNVTLPLVYSGIRANERRERAARLLEQVGLGDRFDHKPNQLSGGQKQRVAIARALVNAPQFILADEPTGALDSKSGAEIEAIFSQLHAEGRTIIIVTHNKALAALTKRIITIHDGQVTSDRCA